MLNKNSLWSIAGGAVPAVTAIIAIPILLGSFGYELFAMVSLIMSLAVFFFVYDFGIGRAVTFFISKQCPEQDGDVTGLVGSALFTAFILGVFSSIFIYCLMPYVAEYWIHIKQKVILEQTVKAFQISALGVLPSILANTCKGILEGKSKFKEANLCKMFSGSTIFIAPLFVLVIASKSLTHVSAAIVVSRYMVLILYIFCIAGIFELKSIKVKFTALQTIYKYGAWAALSGFISTMFVYGDRFIVARYISSEQLSIYIASQDILIRYLLIPWSMAVVLMPVFSAGKLSQIETLKLYQKQQKNMVALSFAVTMLVILIVVIFAHYLAGATYSVISKQVVIIQMVGIFFCSISQLPLIYLYANGMPRLVTMIYLSEAIVYIIIAPVIFSRFGLTGACLIWSGRLVIEYLLLSFFTERLIK